MARSPFPNGEGKEEAASPPKKEANPASLRSAAPSKGRGSRGHSLLPMEGGAPKGRRLDGKSGMKKDRERSSQVRRLREHSSAAGAVPLPQWGRLRNESTAFPILSFRAKARNLFRSRSGKGCEDSGERETPCFQRIGRTVFHADSIAKENGNGKRKRSLGCARDDETPLSIPFQPAAEANPASLRSAAPSKGRGSRGHSLLPMEGGAPKERRLDGGSGISVSKPFLRETGRGIHFSFTNFHLSMI